MRLTVNHSASISISCLQQNVNRKITSRHRKRLLYLEVVQSPDGDLGNNDSVPQYPLSERPTGDFFKPMEGYPFFNFQTSAIFPTKIVLFRLTYFFHFWSIGQTPTVLPIHSPRCFPFAATNRGPDLLFPLSTSSLRHWHG